MNQDKPQLRKMMQATRDAIPDQDRLRLSQLICQHGQALIQLLDIPSPLTVLVYIPFRSEADVWPLAEALLASGHRVAAPRVVRGQGRMDLYAIDGRDALTPGSYGIMEPGEDASAVHFASIDVVVVPGLAFDRQGGRLGYGAGYYDRLFRQYALADVSMPVRIGTGFGAQVVERVPMEAHDYRVDWLVTEHGYVPAEKLS